MEQIERANRYLQRIREMYEGIINPRQERDYYNDDVISFYVHCYHIKDWVSELSKVPITSREVDKFINKHEPLRICADLCNGSKHCTLKRLRTERQPHLSGRQLRASTWLSGSAGHEVLNCKFQIMTSSGLYDALELAEECMKLWADFTNELQKTHNKSFKYDALKNARVLT